MRIFATTIFATLFYATLVLAQPKNKTDSWAPTVSKKGTPTRFAGFKFGWTLRQARQACRRSKHEFAKNDNSRATCTGTANNMGFEGVVSLYFCGKKKELCEVSLRFLPQGDPDKVHWSQWGRAYHQLQASLVEALGEEVQHRVNASESCWTALRERHSAKCFARDARAKHHWALAGFEIALSLARSIRPAHDAPDLICKMRSPIRLLEMSRTSD